MSQKLGGINPEMMKQLTAINESSVSLHDAAKRGDLQKMQEFLADGKDVNAKDFKGVTALGYAVGHDQLSVVKVTPKGLREKLAANENRCRAR